MENTKLIYLHGLESDSSSGKARQFREWFPGMLTPDFEGSFEERMDQLQPILGRETGWTIVGSSFGGLMGTVYTCTHPTRVRKLILLAPALLRDAFGAYLDPSTGSGQRLRPVSVPTTVVHGTEDSVVPLDPAREVAQILFTNLTYIVVDDDHSLHKALHELDWKSLLA
jgi:pimeloyl-ACP methyl ester carboxylesterase